MRNAGVALIVIGCLSVAAGVFVLTADVGRMPGHPEWHRALWKLGDNRVFADRTSITVEVRDSRGDDHCYLLTFWPPQVSYHYSSNRYRQFLLTFDLHMPAAEYGRQKKAALAGSEGRDWSWPRYAPGG